MLVSRFELGRSKKAGFAWWRIVAWVMLLVAGFGCVQYIQHAQQVWSVLQSLPPGDGDTDTVHTILAWDAGYFLAAFAVIIASAGCILRQAWARPVLRVLSLLLAVWLAYRAMLSWYQWRTLNNVRTVLVSMGHPTPEQTAQIHHMQNAALISVGMGVLAVLALLWLAWQLGQPAVRLQFRARSF
jgi:hypothetical protein